ncbi:MAG: transporter substrate-binding domain-containing protein [Oscillospiraceae bacterium]|jgi:ABC-type amino acid transport substrate-binding protein|nr:transporter substrate-binding domain-containing protein [Oscillospiraceae bacterium]
MKTKKTIALLLALLLVSVFAACGKTDAPDSGAQTVSPTPDAGTPGESDGESADFTPPEVIRIGMECEYAPYNWTQFEETEFSVPIGGGAYADGYDVQIAKIIADGLGSRLEVVKTEWDGLPPSLTSGMIDLIIAGMTDTPDRRETIDFTDVYWISDVVIVVMKDGPYANAASLSDFAGAKITGQLSTLHYDLVDKIDGVDKQEAMADFPTMLMSLTSGKIDGYIAERPTALAAELSNPEVTYIAFDAGSGFGEEVPVSVGVRKSDGGLKAAVDAILAGISEDERAQIMRDAVMRQPLAD